MKTLYGDIPEEDILALEYKLDWYMRYANEPSVVQRRTETASCDYGRQYERYIGYLFESNGYMVTYRGIADNLDDGGIDLVARAPRKIRLVQCKRWRHAVGKDIVSRLLGAIDRFVYEDRKGKPSRMRMDIRGVIVCSADVEKEAEEMSRHFGILLRPNMKFRRYPAIKAQRITGDAGRFLLPTSRGYDRMRLDPKRGDGYFSSVREVLARGFFFPQYHGEIMKRIRELKREQAEAALRRLGI